MIISKQKVEENLLKLVKIIDQNHPSDITLTELLEAFLLSPEDDWAAAASFSSTLTCSLEGGALVTLSHGFTVRPG